MHALVLLCINQHMKFDVSSFICHPNGISIGSAIFAGLMNVTNRQTDTQTDHTTLFVTIGHI